MQNTIDELRIALFDIHKSLNEQRIEIKNLQEEVDKIKHLSRLEVKLDHLERTQQKILSDLKQMSVHLHQSEEVVKELEQEIDHVSSKAEKMLQLKPTLDSICKAVDANLRTHKVISGDSLEKIAKKYQISVDALKQTNHLPSDKIVIGQELKIP